MRNTVQLKNFFVDPFWAFNEFDNDIKKTLKPTNQYEANYDRRPQFLEKEDEYLFALELTGVKKDDLNIEFLENKLSIKAIKHNPIATEEDEGFEIERHFTIPDLVNVERISAKLEDGILVLNLPKLEKQKPVKIDIAIG